MIYGLSSKQASFPDLRDYFFKHNVIGTPFKEEEAVDIHYLFTHIRVSDLVYLKSHNLYNNDIIKVKGIGLILNNKIFQIGTLTVAREILWISKEERYLTYPKEIIKNPVHRNFIYAENVPFFQEEILKNLSRCILGKC